MMALLAGLLVSAVTAVAPEPKPFQGVVPDRTFTLPRTGETNPRSWVSRPQRITRYWYVNGVLLYCDDPSCLWCSDYVYGTTRWENVKPIKR